MPKPRINLRLAADIYAKLDEATQRPGVTKSAIIERALREYFCPELRMGLEERILARLDAFDIRQGEIERDARFTLEALGQFIFYWLTRTDPIPDGEREAAHALGQRRFDYFIEQVARKADNGNGVNWRLYRSPADD
ncbi:ribbon-helix-helix domain-containing protein [Henriciella aquimarina]|uniref:ribbon-helix-helix domain-containing protein n=1 Tax=Henriciella aquimarina TaxID=545261 RepID=UPI000A077117|nr:ribbon-helix-helix domain-containing protein [Henriciella aquimarina]